MNFLKAVSEGARSAHGASLLVKRHAGVSQTVVAGVKGDFLIGQAVIAQTGEGDLSCRGGAGCELSEVEAGAGGGGEAGAGGERGVTG